MLVSRILLYTLLYVSKRGDGSIGRTEGGRVQGGGSGGIVISDAFTTKSVTLTAAEGLDPGERVVTHRSTSASAIFHSDTLILKTSPTELRVASSALPRAPCGHGR